MSGGARNNFDGRQWREKVIRTRVNAALADLPPLERQLPNHISFQKIPNGRRCKG